MAFIRRVLVSNRGDAAASEHLGRILKRHTHAMTDASVNSQFTILIVLTETYNPPAQST